MNTYNNDDLVKIKQYVVTKDSRLTFNSTLTEEIAWTIYRKAYENDKATYLDDITHEKYDLEIKSLIWNASVYDKSVSHKDKVKVPFKLRKVSISKEKLIKLIAFLGISALLIYEVKTFPNTQQIPKDLATLSSNGISSSSVVDRNTSSYYDEDGKRITFYDYSEIAKDCLNGCEYGNYIDEYLYNVYSDSEEKLNTEEKVFNEIKREVSRNSEKYNNMNYLLNYNSFMSYVLSETMNPGDEEYPKMLDVLHRYEQELSKDDFSYSKLGENDKISIERLMNKYYKDGYKLSKEEQEKLHELALKVSKGEVNSKSDEIINDINSKADAALDIFGRGAR